MANTKVPQNYPYGSSGQSQRQTYVGLAGQQHTDLPVLGAGGSTSNISSRSGINDLSRYNGVVPTQQAQQARSAKRRFLELCINTGNYTTSLGGIDVSLTPSDGHLFKQICEKYRELRRFSIKRMLMHPVYIHYVKV